MLRSVAPDDKAGTIQRPTVLERRITVYAAIIQEAENYVALDTAGANTVNFVVVVVVVVVVNIVVVND